MKEGERTKKMKDYICAITHAGSNVMTRGSMRANGIDNLIK